MNIPYLIIDIVAFTLFVEILCRIYYRGRYLLPFKSKEIGEYPFNSFIEKRPGPLYFGLKKNFSSPMVNINRMGCRGPQPKPKGEKKRILVIGESHIFGVKLLNEGDLWSRRLEEMLGQRGKGEWEVINAGNPGYNSSQHRAFWEAELNRVEPDILVINMGGNDVSQAWMQGAKWQPDEPWPEEFIMALERKTPWWNRFLSRFCFYFFLRRGLTKRKPFPRLDENFQWQTCLEHISGNYRAVAEQARARGIKVASMLYAFAYDLNPSRDQQAKLNSIQANWRSFVDGRGEYDIQLMDVIKNKWSPEMGMHYIDLNQAFKSHPKRYRMYLDLAHFNASGMRLVAETIYQGIDEKNWWADTE